MNGELMKVVQVNDRDHRLSDCTWSAHAQHRGDDVDRRAYRPDTQHQQRQRFVIHPELRGVGRFSFSGA